MRFSFSSRMILLAVASWFIAPTSHAAITGLKRVASGLSSPIFVTHAPGDPTRLFIAERGTPAEDTNASASIRILDLTTGVLSPTPFLTITGLNNNGEGGLLGMAFHPDYFSTDINNPGRGAFYVNVTANDAVANTPFSTYIRKYTVSGDPNIANPTPTPVLDFTQPQDNHNGGWIGFSPVDGYLYIASGDGGNGNDNTTGHTPGIGNAQDTTNLLGKMLRIDVDGDDFPGSTTQALAKNYAIPSTNPFKAGVGSPADDGGADEVWSYGLRNPFRASFDRQTGDLWIGDVGQDNREEIDFQPASSTGGANYGWRLREGDIPTPTGGVGGDPPANYVPPIYSYTHPDTTVPPVSPSQFNGRLITGGYVYRGPDPSLQGKYFFLDASSNNNWMVNSNPFGTVTNIDSLLTPDVGSASFGVSFGEDAVGNLYIAYIGSGEVYRIATNELLPGDYTADGEVDQQDYNRWRQTFGTTGTNLAADGNKNNVIDTADYVVWRKFLGTSVHDSGGSSDGVPEPTTMFQLAFAATACAISALFRRHRQV